MATRRSAAGIAAVTALAGALAACSGTGDAGEPSGGSEEPSGTITVLTNRTDIVDTTLQDYVETFQETYPDIDVEFEAITDYEGEVRIRMNTPEYGDVLLIPNSVTPDQLPTFFEPLGTVEEMSQKNSTLRWFRAAGAKVLSTDGLGIAPLSPETSTTLAQSRNRFARFRYTSLH